MKRLLFTLLLVVSAVSRAAFAQTTVPTPTTRHFTYAGGDYGLQERLERVPGRHFTDLNGTTVDAVKYLGNNGLNAVRCYVNYGQSLTTASVDNSNENAREEAFSLDSGGIDLQVDIARRARAAGQKVIVTFQMGQDKNVAGSTHEFIPDAWINYTYTQTLSAIDTATRQLLDPFLSAGIQPDMIICENEADSGMLFQTVNASGNEQDRDQANTNPYDNTATGIYRIWPKCAGYYKQEILSAKSEITNYHLDPTGTRFAVHTTSLAGRAPFVFGEIFNNSHSDAEQIYYDPSTGAKGSTMTIIPDTVRNTNLRDLVDVMGFSFYPTPPSAGTQAAYTAALTDTSGNCLNLASFLQSCNTVIPTYGKYTSGPLIGQYKKQALIIEFTSSPGQVAGYDLPRQDAFTIALFNLLAQYPWTAGAMWWEPTEAINNGNGNSGSLFRFDPNSFNAANNVFTTFNAIDTIKYWGAFAAPDPRTQYAITSTSTGNVLNIWQNSTSPNSWTYPSSTTGPTLRTEMWQVRDNNDGTFCVINTRSGLALTDYNASTTAGDKIVQDTLGSPVPAKQKWTLVQAGVGTGNVRLVNSASNLALDVNAQGFAIQNTASTAASQVWRFTQLPKYKIVNANGSALDIWQQSPSAGAWTYGAAMDLYSPTQQWNLIDNANGTYQFLNTNFGGALENYGNSSSTGSSIVQDNPANPASLIQQWSLTSLGNGYSRIANSASGLVLDLNGSGFGVQNSTNNSVQTQQWQLVLQGD